MELILIVNSGSSSHKCSLFEGENPNPIWHAHLQWKEGFRDARLEVEPGKRRALLPIRSEQEGLEELLKTLPDHPITAIGHRVVHGGEHFRNLTAINEEVKQKIGELAYLAPLHNPANLAGIETTEALFPDVPQFAIFDTAFHHTLSEAAATYPIPYKWRTQGVRRYGFHGISYAYCSKRAASLLGREGKILICHLGAGASICAVDRGKSIDTTMGMTPLEGLMMASRSGTVDPGVVLHLIQQEKLSPEEVDKILNKKSGLLGVSGLSEDMRDILKAAEGGNKQAQLAYDVFIHRLQEYIGMLTATLGGIDALVFTAGIGENTPQVRQDACARFAYVGLKLDPEKNASPESEERDISAADSRVKVFVIPTQEEWEIGRQIRAFLQNQFSYRS